MATAFLKAEGATKVTRRSTGPDELVIEAVFPGEDKPRAIEIQAHGSATAFSCLANSGCDIGMSSRPINVEELDHTKSLGDLSSPSSENVIGLDGVAVIVNNANRVQSLTINQLRDIFSGKINNWMTLGGSNERIQVLARDDKSGTWETFKTLVLSNEHLAADASRFEGSSDIAAEVASNPGGIGFVGLPYIRGAKPVAISETEGPQGNRSTPPVVPTERSVATEDYPLARRLYFYTAVTPDNSLATRFIRFAKSEEGQMLVRETGFVPLTLNLQVRRPRGVQYEEPPHASNFKRYRSLVAGATRLRFTFEFENGSSALDRRAIDDVKHVAALLHDLKYDEDHVILLGFADDKGNDQLNCRLSLDRAKSVGYRFAMADIRAAKIEGMCDSPQIAGEVSPTGKESKRRVEVWVK